MKNLIKKVYDKFSKIFWTFMFWLIWGTVGGLMLFIVIGFTRYCFIYAVIFSAFFLPFHLSDYKTFYRESNWIAIVGRSVCLYSIGAGVSGFIATMGGLIDISIDYFDRLILLGCFLFSFSILGFAIILKIFFKESRVYKFFTDIFEGMHLMGVLWRY